MEAFAAWQRACGCELTGGERSLIAGFLALAGREPVTPEHIAHGIELARGAAISDRTRLEQLGAQLLAFEAARAAVSPPPLITLDEPPLVERDEPPHVERDEPPHVERDAPPPVERDAPPPAVSAPLHIMIRSTTKIATVAPAAVAEATREPTDELDATPPAAAGPRRWSPRVGMRTRVATVAALAALAVAAAIYPRHDEPAPAPAARAAADPPQRLRRLALAVRLPPGWREAGDAELGAFTSQRDATVVFRGQTPVDPEHGIFIAASTARGDDLIATARTAERGVIRQLGIAASAYHPAGCAQVAMGGGRAARCRGIAERGEAAVGVEIYVRVVAGRTIVALSLARTSQASASADAAAIVASFTP